MKKILGVFLLFMLFGIFNSTNATLVVGSDKDEHGCIGSAGYIWSDFKEECVRPWEEIASKEELKECSSYYDGCNTCSVNEDGTLGACTEMACETLQEPKCLETRKNLASEGEFCGGIAGVQCNTGLVCQLDGDYADAGGTCVDNSKISIEEYNFDKMCSNLGGERSDASLDIEPYCNIKGIGKVPDIRLRPIYNDISGNNLYLGGSKYFDETTGDYNIDLMATDYQLLSVILDNKFNFSDTFITNAQNTINNIKQKLGTTLIYKLDLGLEMGYKLKNSAEAEINKYINKIKSENTNTYKTVIQNKVEQIEKIINSLEDKTNQTRKEKLLIPVLKYCAVLLAEV